MRRSIRDRAGRVCAYVGNAIGVSTVLRDNGHAHDGADPVQAGRAQRGDRSCSRMRGPEMLVKPDVRAISPFASTRLAAMAAVSQS
ncbi:hypothetical protein AB7M37_005247 [Sinorhizobium fredii]